MTKKTTPQEEESKFGIEKVAELSIDDMDLVDILSHDKTVISDEMPQKSMAN